jgi:hypothetical protein
VRGLDVRDPTRLFTYKVAGDSGSAPNPYFGLCTLAICKPRIRKYAVRGDIVVGFGCKSNTDPEEEFRVVYAMQVEEVLPWRAYIDRCHADIQGKIPAAKSLERYAGDCIYVLDGGHVAREPLPSASNHDAASFRKDVESGENVLMSRLYWYFGRGNAHRLVLPKALHELSPRFQGERSNANTLLIPSFVGWFNEEVAARRLAPGIHGMPKDGSIGEPGDIAAYRAPERPAAERKRARC